MSFESSNVVIRDLCCVVMMVSCFVEFAVVERIEKW